MTLGQVYLFTQVDAGKMSAEEMAEKKTKDDARKRKIQQKKDKKHEKAMREERERKRKLEEADEDFGDEVKEDEL